MADSSEEVEVPDLTEKAAFGLLKRIEDALPGHTSFSDGKEDVVIEALTRHGHHLSAHDITQKALDPLKLACWICGSLLDRLEKDDGGKSQGKIIVGATIRVLQETLLLETDKNVCLSKSDEHLISCLVIHEYFENPDHGIGVNGLYLAFHCAVAAYRATSSR